MRISIGLLLLSICFTFCKSKSFTPYEYEKEKIIFGSGGGFTGAVKEYTLLSNGQFFKGTNTKDYIQEMEKLDKQEVKQIFENYKVLGFDDLNIDSPGNMYKYIIFKEGSTEHKIQWGDRSANPPNELVVFFSNLKRMVKIHNLPVDK